MLTVPTSVQHYSGGLGQYDRQEKEIKGKSIVKEGINLSLFLSNIILYVANPKESTEKL